MDESPIFYSIKDVSKQLGLPSHVLRFWETKFPEIKPVHRSGSCRYYRKDDVELLIRIQDLLHNQGYTIKGARAVLEQGDVVAGAGSEVVSDATSAVSHDSVDDSSAEKLPDMQKALEVQAAQNAEQMRIALQKAEDERRTAVASALAANQTANNEIRGRLGDLRLFVQNILESNQK